MSQEYVVRVPREEIKKQFHVMKFSSNQNIDISKFKHCKMERENLFKEVKEETIEELPEFGAGSEYGRKEREEARRRKFERRKHKQNNSPWILKSGGKQGKKYKGTREGGVTENTSYYVFFKAPDGAFEAYPVNEWYNFTPFQRYKALSAEEAEEKFEKRDQILNYFPLKMMSKKPGEGDADESKKKSDRAMKKEFKVTDMDDWFQSDNENLSDESGDEDLPKRNKVKKEKKEKKKKKSESDEEDEPLEESDEGDYDDKEVDYMSDSSSSSESEVDKSELKGVADESALRDLVLSDDENQDENKEENSEQAEDNKTDNDKKAKVNEALSDSEFDSENSDLDDSKSALLIQSKGLEKVKSEPSESSIVEVKASTSESNSASGSGRSNGLKFKHKLESSETGHISNKKQKVHNDNSSGITEDAVRRYLMRKPMTCSDLVLKFKNKVHQRDDLVKVIADILKKLNPEKQSIKNKMYFSLRS